MVYVPGGTNQIKFKRKFVSSRFVRELLLLGGQTIDIPREEGCFFDVSQTDGFLY